MTNPNVRGETMDEASVQELEVGIYQIHWKSGGSSIAAVGVTRMGGRWMAPLNWVSPTKNAKAWRGVQSVTRLGLHAPPVIRREGGLE